MAVTFSTIIITYNQKRELNKVLQSIQAQSFKDLEVIVVDDGSKKDNLKIIKKRWKFPLKYIWQPDIGFRAGSCRNLGAKIAKGEYLHFIDGDTLVGEQTYRPYINYLDNKTLLFGLRYVVYRKILRKKINQETIDCLVKAKDFRNWKQDILFSGANFIVPREKFLKVLWADDWNWYGYDDYEFFDRWYAANYPSKCIKQSIAYHLDHQAKEGDKIAALEWYKRRDKLREQGKNPYEPLFERKKWFKHIVKGIKK